MSRGFVKEDDQEEIPMIPPRADLPAAVPNYVTMVGMEEMRAEKKLLLEEKKNLDTSNEKERRIAANHIDAKLQLLEERITSARIIDLAQQPQDEVRFGAKVTLEIEASNKTQTFQIVGVDEANISKGKIAFTSPVARALNNKKVGESAVVERKPNDLVFKILEIRYE